MTAGAPATKRGWYPHKQGSKELRALKALGCAPDRRSEHHLILSRDPWIEYWPSRGKYRIGKFGTVLMGSFSDLCADVQEAMAEASGQAVCALCGDPVAEAGRKHHDACLIRASLGDAAERAEAWRPSE